MEWYQTFDSVFWITIAGMLFGVIGVVMKSRCRQFSCCWGVFQIERDIQAEIEFEQMRTRQLNRQRSIQLGQSPNPSIEFTSV